MSKEEGGGNHGLSVISRTGRGQRGPVWGRKQSAADRSGDEEEEDTIRDSLVLRKSAAVNRTVSLSFPTLFPKWHPYRTEVFNAKTWKYHHLPSLMNPSITEHLKLFLWLFLQA